MWGIRKICWAIRLQQRITPTCVGNTQLFVEYLGTVQDHPHMCGEYLLIVVQLSLISGSPPHVWGIHAEEIMSENTDRITPTCVGNTSPTQHANGENRDHPHMCGEYTKETPPNRYSKISKPPFFMSFVVRLIYIL